MPVSFPKIPPISEAKQLHYIELICKGGTFKDIAADLKCHLYQLFVYRRDNPEFEEMIQAARLWSAQVLEDALRELIDKKDLTHNDRVRLEIYRVILIARDPKRYNPKLEINVTQTVDIAQALLDARSRILIEAPDINDIDVTPIDAIG